MVHYRGLFFITLVSSLSLCGMEDTRKRKREEDVIQHKESQEQLFRRFCQALLEKNNAEARSQVKVGLDLNEIDSQGYSPLNWAIYYRNYDVMNFLLGEEAPIDLANGRGGYPLHYAVASGDLEIIKILLFQRDPDMSVRDASGQFPLDYLNPLNPHAREMVYLFLEKGLSLGGRLFIKMANFFDETERAIILGDSNAFGDAIFGRLQGSDPCAIRYLCIAIGQGQEKFVRSLYYTFEKVLRKQYAVERALVVALMASRDNIFQKIYAAYFKDVSTKNYLSYLLKLAVTKKRLALVRFLLEQNRESSPYHYEADICFASKQIKKYMAQPVILQEEHAVCREILALLHDYERHLRPVPVSAKKNPRHVAETLVPVRETHEVLIPFPRIPATQNANELVSDDELSLLFACPPEEESIGPLIPLPGIALADDDETDADEDSSDDSDAESSPALVSLRHPSESCDSRSPNIVPDIVNAAYMTGLLN